MPSILPAKLSKNKKVFSLACRLPKSRGFETAWRKAQGAFRSFKSIGLNVRPIRHRLEDRVRAHIFLCMFAYYVQWHMIEAWRPLLFCDEDQAAKERRDPVTPAKRSKAALMKAHTCRLRNGERACLQSSIAQAILSFTKG